MEKLTNTIFTYLLEQIKIYFANPDLVVSEFKDQADIYFQNWMSIILISNSDFRMTLKVYCKESDVKILGNNAISRIEASSSTTISDFVKELANLLGGTIKRAFETSGISSGLSLPLLVRAFDDLFFTESSSSEHFHIKYEKNGVGVIVQLYFEFLTKNSKENLSQLKLEDPSVGTGEFEFL